MDVCYAIPYNRYDDICRELEATGELVEVAAYSISAECGRLKLLPKERIASFHGPSVPLKKEFLSDLKRGAGIARNLDVPFMIVHPHRVKVIDEALRLAQQRDALQILDELCTDGFDPVVETFGGKTRVLHPEEIIKHGLWMDLDTSHLDAFTVYELVGTHAKSIRAVHLSERVGEENHHPITCYSESILELLLKQNWNGTLCLDYEDCFISQVRNDTMYVRHIIEGMCAVKNNEFDSAMAKFVQAVEKKPEGYLGNYGVGMIFVRQQKFEQALEHLQCALDAYKSADALLFKSLALHGMGKREEAEECRGACVRIAPEYSTLFTGIRLHPEVRRVPFSLAGLQCEN